jgi:hypothetical protein
MMPQLNRYWNIAASGKSQFPDRPPQISAEPASVAEEVTLDYDFFEQNSILILFLTCFKKPMVVLCSEMLKYPFYTAWNELEQEKF